MSEPIQIALIVAVAPTLLALAGMVNSVRNGRKLNTIHIDLNSRLTQLLLASTASAHANGKAEGVAQERAAQISE